MAEKQRPAVLATPQAAVDGSGKDLTAESSAGCRSRQNPFAELRLVERIDATKPALRWAPSRHGRHAP